MQNEIRKDVALGIIPMTKHICLWMVLTLSIPDSYSNMRTFLIIYEYSILFILVNMLGLWIFPPPSYEITNTSSIGHKKNTLLSLAVQAFCIYLFTRYVHVVSTIYWLKVSMFYTAWCLYVLIIVILLTLLLIGKSFPKLLTTPKP